MVGKKVDIVIIGAGLTGLTLAYYLEKSGKKVMVLEKADRVGGVINTAKENGFVFEKGPNTGVIGSEGIVQLFDDLKNDCEYVTPNKEAEERWILKNGRWEALPSGLLQAIKTPLFSLKDKFRILGEPWRKKGTDPDETLTDMVKRRLGQSYLDYAVDPFISGIYAGDPNVLVTRYAMPKLYNLEQNYGSFVIGAAKKKKESKTELQKKITRAVFSAPGGLNSLINALGNNISKEAICCNCNQIKTYREKDRYRTEVFLRNNEKFSVGSDKVITTFGGDGLADVLNLLPQELLKPLVKLTYAKVVQVAVGYNTWKGKDINAFGGLVPSKENRDILGILFPGALFKGRCPEGGAMLSVFIGGVKKPEMIEKTDQEIKGTGS